jgi:hypothetical protein
MPKKTRAKHAEIDWNLFNNLIRKSTAIMPIPQSNT